MVMVPVRRVLPFSCRAIEANYVQLDMDIFLSFRVNLAHSFNRFFVTLQFSRQIADVNTSSADVSFKKRQFEILLVFRSRFAESPIHFSSSLLPRRFARRRRRV